jgi:fatty-acyl-CoA synthase
MDVSRWVAHWAAWNGERTALRFEGDEISYAEMEQRVGLLAGMLAGSLGVKQGDRVAHLGYNSPELLELLFACARIGALLVPLNWRLTPAEHTWILEHCGAMVLVAEAPFYGHVETIGLPRSVRLVGYDAPVDAGWLDYRDLVAEADYLEAGEADRTDLDLSIVYTSGTTGRPKGSVVSQSALFYNAVNATTAHDLTSSDHVLTVLPMFHVGGMNIHTTPAIHAGARITIHRRFDAAVALAEIDKSRPTLFLAVPAVIEAMRRHPAWAETDVSSLRLVGVGSSAVPEALIRAWHERGIPVSQTYGLTESTPVAVVLAAQDAERKIGAAGKPVAHCQVRVVNDSCQPVPAGERGEIVLKGPNVLTTYWNDPQTTRSSFTGEWFHTGDIGHFDDEGFLFVDDRKKDVIISGGENIYPAELENVLADSPDIAEFAVVAGEDPRWGEVPVACIVPKQAGALNVADVLALFRDRLARFKHPKQVVFLDALPRNAMGKVLKFELRETIKGDTTDAQT